MQPGNLVSAALTGVWRRTPPAPCLSPAELAEIAPLLLAAGAGGLGWWRVRHTELGTTPAAAPLRQAYRHYSLQAALHEREVIRAVTLLRSAGVEPLLAKGWAVARLYPETGLRPYGDNDLCVRPEQYAAARAALSEDGCAVDLHRGLEHTGFSLLDDRSLDALFDRSQLVPLGDIPARIPGPEDHLRLLCLHALGHGLVRPLWLCDVAVALENRPEQFDWDWCLGGSRRRADWVACALGLAHHLLGVRLDDTPIAERADRLPHWLLPTVLREWGRMYRRQVPLGSYARNPLGAVKELRHRWPNPIEGTVGVGGPFNDWPRLPFQVGALIRRAVRYLASVPRLQRQRG